MKHLIKSFYDNVNYNVLVKWTKYVVQCVRMNIDTLQHKIY